MAHKILATLDTADFSNCTSIGYRFTLYSDGHVSAERHSRWQGSRDGARWVTDSGAVDLSELDESDPDYDALALLTIWAGGEDPQDDEEQGFDGTWRQTRRGFVVR